MDLPKTDMHKLKEHDQEFRILPYTYYSSDKVVLGMEEKDMKDVCAVLLDHQVGEGKEEIGKDKIRKTLDKDKKMALTVTLNLQNLMQRTETLTRWMKQNEIATVTDRVNELLGFLPKVDKKWDKPWWNVAVETPLIG